MNSRSNKIAHQLQKLGVGSEVLVGICVGRSIELIVGMLGILKAGGAYLPLDPTYPSALLSFMLEDAQAPILLTQERWSERLAHLKGQIITLEITAQQSEENPTNDLTSDNLAYVIYTSGSTGKPKGVQVEHGGLLNLLFWHQQAFAVSPLDRVSQIAGVGFDACGWEIWPYLTAGASIHFPDDETRVSPERLRDWLKVQAISISFLPTPLAEKVLQLDWPDDTALRILLTGGDKLHQYPLASHPFKLVNNYGLTETTVVTTSADIPAFTKADVTPAIGRPIANTQVYLLDSHLQPVPIGVPGELHIGGDGLARSYLNRPELTAERFIPHPFSHKEGVRLYKTGDLARYRADGNIEFLGRLDDQVKINGFRIELGEIEAVLSQHPEVLQTVAIAREDRPGEKRLVAYIVPRHDPAPRNMELRQFLKEKLPQYMIPASFAILDALPTTPNGKVDRRILPAPEALTHDTIEDYAAPRNTVEETLVEMWAEILGLQQVSIYDNFFELGGHSLLATKVTSRIRDTFQVELPLRNLFEAPTVADMARYIETICWAAKGLNNSRNSANKREDVEF
ncbi:MAG: hypothetical protein NVS2B14_05490 [Chamaesiphon sp.]